MMEAAYKAGVIGAILVVLFMILVFRFLGLVADITLLIYLILDLAVLKLLNVTLTLPVLQELSSQSVWPLMQIV
ncbi:MAG: hypothetical protein ABDH34_03465 [Dictyoglomus thermophilum]